MARSLKSAYTQPAATAGGAFNFAAPDLTKYPPRSPRARLGGFAHLPRLLDKARATVVSTNGDYHYDCPVDHHFWEFTGIKPAPVRWVLSLGGIDPNKEQGLRELEQTAAHGNLLKPFAKLLLAVAALRDKNNLQGCGLLHQLATAYPRNALYRNAAPECR